MCIDLPGTGQTLLFVLSVFCPSGWLRYTHLVMIQAAFEACQYLSEIKECPFCAKWNFFFFISPSDTEYKRTILLKQNNFNKSTDVPTVLLI